MKSRESEASIPQTPPAQTKQNSRAASTVDSSFISASSRPSYEAAAFLKPHLEQFQGVLPDLNRRLSSERELGLSPTGLARLSPEAHPRLFTTNPEGLSFPILPSGVKIQPKVPKRTRFEVETGLSAPSLLEKFDRAFGLEADLGICSIGSRFFKARADKGEKS
ncbi:MAG: hypothetical protein PHU28_03590 [Methanosarcinaceae archaeon]|nr:hypothetical protein [Methanosarcinaceae archaeon]